MAEKIITKSFERLLDKGKHRGFITYEELGKSLGKRNGTLINIEKAFIVLVDEISLQYMDGAEIDWVDDLIGASFKINNPVATSSCGCGTSFSV